MQVFYCPEITEEIAYLSEEESFHCVKVLRLTKGEKVKLINGKGSIYEAVIIEPNSKRCSIRIQTKSTPSDTRNFKIHIAIAPTKSIERFEWFVEKAVEIGIDIITPLLCEHSERRILKTERLEKIIISSMKQAVILNKPVINELTSIDSFLKEWNNADFKKFIAHCNGTEKISLNKALTPDNNIIILIGPEGDFSVNEVQNALNYGYIPVSLGDSRLRTETAGIVACNTVVLVNDFSRLVK